jgi:hypothetical protein
MPGHWFRSVFLLAFVALAHESAYAQAPPTGPLVLHVPVSARTAALANAWVAGRDQEVVFHNPAQLIGARPGFDASLTRFSEASHMLSAGSVFAAGKWSLTFGWGAQVLGLNADAATSYPYSPDLLLAGGARSGTSTLVTAGAAILVKKFRIGVAGKYASDLGTASAATLLPLRANHQVVLVDVGVARNLLGGAAAIAFQNLGRHSRDNGGLLNVPRQVALGWSTTKVAGPFDVGVYTQVTARRDWTAPAAGIEVGYSWIEGLSVQLRAGARRPETSAEKPLSLGAAFTLDRLTVEYAARFFNEGRTANGVTLRWR